MFRTLTIARRRRGWSPPRAAAFVLEYLPPWQMVPRPDEGVWQLQTLDNWLAGTPDGELGSVDGPADMPGGDLRAFAESEFGGPVRLDWFEVDSLPAYWVTVAA